MTSTPAPAPQKTEKGTEYVILTRKAGVERGTSSWYDNARIHASSKDAAVRKFALAQPGNDAGEIVAIPARSFVPTKVTVETTKTVKLG